MILVDKDMKARIANQELIISGYDENHVNGVSYELMSNFHKRPPS